MVQRYKEPNEDSDSDDEDRKAYKVAFNENLIRVASDKLEVYDLSKKKSNADQVKLTGNEDLSEIYGDGPKVFHVFRMIPPCLKGFTYYFSI